MGKDKDIGYVYILLHKETSLYKIGRTINKSRRFKELDVGVSTELLNCFRVFNHKLVEKKCHSIFKKKRLPQTEYFNLDKEDLEKLFEYLDANKFKTTKVLRKERDVRNIERLLKERDNYQNASNFRKFTIRNKNLLSGAFGCGFMMLIFSPFIFGFIMVLNAYNLGWLIIFPFLGLGYLVASEQIKQDNYLKQDLLVDENIAVKKLLDSWKKIDEKVGEDNI